MINKLVVFLTEMEIVSGISSHENFITFLINVGVISDNEKMTTQEFKAFENNFRSVLNEFNILDNQKVELEIEGYIEDKVCFILTIEEN